MGPDARGPGTLAESPGKALGNCGRFQNRRGTCRSRISGKILVEESRLHWRRESLELAGRPVRRCWGHTAESQQAMWAGGMLSAPLPRLAPGATRNQASLL